MRNNETEPEKPNNTSSSSGASNAPMSKEEMRQKIRESLAKRTAEEEVSASTNSEDSTQNQQNHPQPTYRTAPQPQQRYESRNHESSRSQYTSQNRPTQSSPQLRQQSQQNPRQNPQRSDSRSNRYDVYGSEYNDTAPYRTRTRVNPTKIILIVVLAIVIVLVVVYLIGFLTYRDKFLPNTTINGTSVSGMTPEEAENLLVSQAQDMGITFVARDGEEYSFQGSAFGCTTSMDENALDEAYSESHALWFTKLFSSSDYTVTLNQTYSEDALASLIAAYNWGNVAPTDAKIVEESEGNFVIVPEDNGNMVDTTILSEYTLEQVRNGNTVIYMEMSGCYATAKVTAESLQDTLDVYTKYTSIVITYDMTNREALFDPVGSVDLDYHTFMDWVTIDSDGTLTLNKEAAAEWVEKYIAEPYDTYSDSGYTRQFESTLDGTVDVNLTTTSIYGWQTDIDATVDKMEEYLQAGESVSVEPEWVEYQSGSYRVGFRPNRSDGTSFGEGTYIEVDICHQHLWFYVGGELYMDTDVVTGLASDLDRQTHTGIFKIREKQEGAILGTYEVQGYEQYVSYWMPIDHTGIGLHDLSRSAYGGEIYLTNGSHGCINLPYSAAQEIYEEVVVGLPVVIID